eukprot:902149_1
MIAFGFKNVNAYQWITASILATYTCIALQAAVSTSSGQIKQIFKFYIIVFSVLSAYIGCNESPNECKLLFPTDRRLFVVCISVIIGILFVGFFIHFLLLPICK